MTLTDQVDYLITASGIHRGPLAGKLGKPTAARRGASRDISARVFDRTRLFSDSGATSTEYQYNAKPIQINRFAFGELKPVHIGPDASG